MNAMQQYTEKSEFNYHRPQLNYDKKTGEVTIVDPNAGKEKKIVKTFKELEQEKKRLFKEIGIKTDADPVTEKQQQELAMKMEKFAETMRSKYGVDPTEKYTFSRDFMRVDIGLIIMRPPIFMQFHDRDFAFLKARTHHMNEYYMDLKKYVDSFNEVAMLNDSVLSQNSYASKTNIDNFPTHEKRSFDTKTGETVVKSYCAASKNFALVDPRCQDRRSIHYAAEDRTYLIMKNKYTGRWEFPTSKITIGTTLLRGK
jgi:hypothetical protein